MPWTPVFRTQSWTSAARARGGMIKTDISLKISTCRGARVLVFYNSTIHSKRGNEMRERGRTEAARLEKRPTWLGLKTSASNSTSPIVLAAVTLIFRLSPATGARRLAFWTFTIAVLYSAIRAPRATTKARTRNSLSGPASKGEDDKEVRIARIIVSMRSWLRQKL